jgi:hypothetical protein
MAHPRGSVAVVLLIALALAEMMVIGMIVTGGRDQDMTVDRLESARAFYASESGMNMAVRELMDNADEDGDGTVGSIAHGSTVGAPPVGGARAAAGVSVSGQNYTLTAVGESSRARRALSLGLRCALTPMDPLAAYSDMAASTAPVRRLHSSGAWGSAASGGALSGPVAWQVADGSAAGAAGPVRALITLAGDDSLWVSRSAGGTWDAASLLTAGTGTSNTRVFDAKYEGRSGNLMIAYRKGASASVYYRTYTTPTPSEQSFSLGLAGAASWMELVGKPNANEMVIVVAAASGLYAGVWNGSSWGNATTLEASLPSGGRPFHAAYSSQSGTAMVVWTATTGAPKYATWNGTSWSGAASVPAIGGGAPAGWLTLAASPARSSNEILLACIGTDNQINVNRWSGSAWGSNLVVETAARASHQQRVDVGYQPDGAKALVVWHRLGQTRLYYRTLVGGAWSSEQAGPDMTTESETIRLARGAGQTEQMMLVRRANPSSYDLYTLFSETADYDIGSTTIIGPVGSSAGNILPPPPSATGGTTNLSPSGGSIAPGAYGTLTVGNNTTIGFSAGTYVFSSWTTGNSDTYNFDTSAGPISIIITTGGMSGSNNAAFINTGNGTVQINVNTGDVSFNNDTVFTNIDILVYNGSATFKNNTDGSLGLYTSGTVSFKNNGTISPNSLHVGASPACSAVLWTNGSPGARIDLDLTLPPAGVTDACALAGSPRPPSPTVNSLSAVAP